jgi:acyl-coenzyme A thioesterase PaaI-like protein
MPLRLIDLPPAFALRTADDQDASVRRELEFAETALGPFGAVFGGMAAGVLVDQARSMVSSDAQVATATFDFVRPTAPGTVQISSEIVQQGRRMTLVAVSMRQGGKLTAEGRIALVQKLMIAGLPASPPPPWAGCDPLEFPEPRRPRLSTLWSGDLLEVRADEQAGIRWFKRRDEALMPLTTPAFAIAVSDYAAGTSRPDSWESPTVRAFPNPNLFVSLLREPQGEWVGLRARSLWGAAGVGLSHAELADRDGSCGFAEMVCLLVPLSEGR